MLAGYGVVETMYTFQVPLLFLNESPASAKADTLALVESTERWKVINLQVSTASAV